jgi:hypothetical protein
MSESGLTGLEPCERRWPFVDALRSEITVFGEGRHSLLAPGVVYEERKVVGVELQVAGRGYAVLRDVCIKGDSGLLREPWTVLSPHATTLNRETLRVLRDGGFGSCPTVAPTGEGQAVLDVIGDVQVTLALLFLVTKNDMYGPGIAVGWLRDNFGVEIKPIPSLKARS